MKIDDSSTQPRTRPDIHNLIQPQSTIELLTSEDLFDMVMIMTEEAAIDKVDIKKPVASSSQSSNTLNSAWGGFMQRAVATSSKSKSTKLEGKKRRRSPGPDEETKKAKYEPISGPTGLSGSAQAEKRYAAELDTGEFDLKKMIAFKEACLRVDAHAEFPVERLRAVRCSSCGKETVCAAQKGAPNHRRFIQHHQRCVSGVIRNPITQAATVNTSTLFGGAFKGFQKLSKLSVKVSHLLKHSFGSPHSNTTPPTAPTHLPCPGITEADHPKVLAYLHRSSALGGGSRSIL